MSNSLSALHAMDFQDSLARMRSVCIALMALVFASPAIAEQGRLRERLTPRVLAVVYPMIVHDSVRQRQLDTLLAPEAHSSTPSNPMWLPVPTPSRLQCAATVPGLEQSAEQSRGVVCRQTDGAPERH